MVLKGQSINLLERYHEALEPLIQATELDDQLADAWHELGLVRNELEQHEEALQAFDMAMHLNTEYADNADVLFVRWFALIKLERFQEAVEGCLEHH